MNHRKQEFSEIREVSFREMSGHGLVLKKCPKVRGGHLCFLGRFNKSEKIVIEMLEVLARYSFDRF